MTKSSNPLRSIFSLKVIIPVIILMAAAAGAYATVVTAPKAVKHPPAAIRPSVETKELTKEDHRVWLNVMGTVTPAHEITLEAEVSGKVLSTSDTFMPGGFFAKGDPVLTIDPEDYQLALNEVQSEVADAEYDLKVELGYQNVSAREWKLLKGSAKGTESESELALRKPHLAKAKAALEAARAKLKQAQLDLDRTTVTAPFAAMVETKSTDVGAVVAEQETLATLIGTDEFWIEASVPVDRLGWIHFPNGNGTEGAIARVVSGSGATRTELEGRVIRLLPSLETEGRMARILISVKDPLNLAGEPGRIPLLLDSYVSVSIDGGVLPNSFAVPRSAYHENGKVWVLSKDNTLDIRTLTPAWRDEETLIFTKGLENGDQLVTSALSAPVEGMALQSVSDAKSRPAEAEQPAPEVNNG